MDSCERLMRNKALAPNSLSLPTYDSTNASWIYTVDPSRSSPSNSWVLISASIKKLTNRNSAPFTSKVESIQDTPLTHLKHKEALTPICRLHPSILMAMTNDIGKAHTPIRNDAEDPKTIDETIQSAELISAALTAASLSYNPTLGVQMTSQGSLTARIDEKNEVRISKQKRIEGSWMSQKFIMKCATQDSEILVPHNLKVGRPKGISLGKGKTLGIIGDIGTGVWIVNDQGLEQKTLVNTHDENCGGVDMPVDLVLSPFNTGEFAMIDGKGNWVVRRCNESSISSTISLKGDMESSSHVTNGKLDQQLQSANWMHDGWARIMYVLRGDALLFCSRTQIQVLEIGKSKEKLLQLPESSASWILDIKSIERQEKYVFLLTTQCIIWMELNANHLSDDISMSANETLLSIKHKHNGLDLNLRMTVAEFDNFITILLYSQSNPLIECYNLELCINRVPILHSGPSLIILPQWLWNKIDKSAGILQLTAESASLDNSGRGINLLLVTIMLKDKSTWRFWLHNNDENHQSTEVPEVHISKNDRSLKDGFVVSDEEASSDTEDLDIEKGINILDRFLQKRMQKADGVPKTTPVNHRLAYEELEMEENIINSPTTNQNLYKIDLKDIVQTLEEKLGFKDYDSFKGKTMLEIIANPLKISAEKDVSDVLKRVLNYLQHQPFIFEPSFPPSVEYGLEFGSQYRLCKALSSLFVDTILSKPFIDYRAKRIVDIQSISTEVFLSSLNFYQPSTTPSSISFLESSSSSHKLSSRLSHSQFDNTDPNSDPNPKSKPYPNPSSSTEYPTPSSTLQHYISFSPLPNALSPITTRILNHWALGEPPDSYDYLFLAKADQEATQLEQLNADEREELQRRQARRQARQARESQRFTQQMSQVGSVSVVAGRNDGMVLSAGNGSSTQAPGGVSSSTGLRDVLKGKGKGKQEDTEREEGPPRKKKRTKGF